MSARDNVLKLPATRSRPGEREFKMPDGRRVSVLQTDVRWLIESKTPGQTIVHLRGAEKAMPLAVSYDDLKAWVNSYTPKPKRPRDAT